MSPVLDLFITLLSMGSITWKQLLRQRKENYAYLHGQLEKLAEKHGTRVLQTKRNDISIGVSLDMLDSPGDNKRISFLGSMLFSRFVSGTRYVPAWLTKIEGS